jgi:hypothetical protein
MQQVPALCCANLRGRPHQTIGNPMSTGLPSPPRSRFASPAVPDDARRAPASRQTPAANDSVGGRRWAPSPTFTAAEIAIVALAGVLLAVLASWPLVLHMSSRIAPDLGDPVRTAWQIAWVGHAMLHDPLHVFDSNAFYPHPLSLAFSDSLLGYGPTAFFGSGTAAALVRYNLLFLWAWSFCFFGAYLLARELGLGRLGGAAAGMAFAYAPYRVTEAGHLHVISSGGLACGLFLLLRGYRRGSRGLVLGGWLLSAWQISLGFTLGLQYAYLLAMLALLALAYWWRGRLNPGPAWGAPREQPPPQERPGGRIAPRAQGGPSPASAPRRGRARRAALIPRQLLAVTLIGIAAVGAVTAYEARPYLRVAALYPTAKRTIHEVEIYSAGPAALLGASSENRVWGSLTSGMRAKVNSKNESVFFPGGLILVLALIGLAAGAYTRRLRIGLALGIATCSILALGLGLTGAGYPYRLLFDYAPGWDGVRVPGRVFTLATLFYALLAGAGAQVLVGRLGAWARRRRDGAPAAPRTSSRRAFALPALGLPALAGAVLLIGILGEGAGHLGHPFVPQPARAEVGVRGPILDLPTDGALDRIWQYYSTDGFPRLANGESTFDIPREDDLRGGMAGFPDKASVEKLRFYGIHTVVLHTALPKELPPERGFVAPEPEDPAANAKKSIAGLGITRRTVGPVVIYEIGPGPKALHGTD